MLAKSEKGRRMLRRDGHVLPALQVSLCFPICFNYNCSLTFHLLSMFDFDVLF